LGSARQNETQNLNFWPEGKDFYSSTDL